MDALCALERKVIYTEAYSISEAIRLNQKVILLDSRSFMVYNTSHIHTAINVGGNRAFQRKFSQNQVSSLRISRYFLTKVPLDLLLCKLTNFENPTELQKLPIVVYDEFIDSILNLIPGCFLFTLLTQLTLKFPVVFLLKGGFLGFQAQFPELCWINTEKIAGEDFAEYHQCDCPLEQILDTCLCYSSAEFSKIPASECDILSTSGATTHPTSISSIPSTSISLKPTSSSFQMPSKEQFSESAKAAHGRVLIHCSAGISRSPTLAIAYLMYSCRMKMHEAYDVVKSGRNSVAPNFNFLGQLLEFEHQLHDSGCSEASIPIDSTPTFDSPASLCSIRSMSTEVQSSSMLKSGLHSSSFSLNLTPTSPKVLSKKRERPTYLGLEATSSSFAGVSEGPVRKSSLHCGGSVRPIFESGISPTEEKRSRVSALLSPTQSSNPLLPSPCTGLSKLEISSPLEEYRSLLSVSRAPSSFVPGHVLPGPESAIQMLKFKPFLSSYTSLQTLRFEPCSTVMPPHPIHLATTLSPASILRLRRSSSTVGTTRPTLLAQRRLSSHASAPPTPRPVSTDGSHPVYRSILHAHGAFRLPSNLPSTSSSRVRELSPSNPISQEPKLEYEQLQKCNANTVGMKSFETQVVPTGCSKSLSYCRKPSLPVNLLRSHSNESLNTSYIKRDKFQGCLISSPRCFNTSNLSRSAPSQRDIDLVFFGDQGFSNNSSHLFSVRRSLPVPGELTSSSLMDSKRFDPGQLSTNLKMTNIANTMRLIPKSTSVDNSCRLQQQFLVQSSGNSSPPPSTSHNSPHNSSSCSLFPIS
ncbi:putative dual specificity protein phosphatase [Schistosoma mansoni]|uniref:putative dual specificity protein phosphatase n=1 Tax=Schistosoma mansoni TaxID=6183 RepID=UPI0001A6389B|nr:putative dual specificity protein phosphatase [Schistosoma mansoni]|eukprot:XP_018654939.1 putative dual specificity protein phosphatase [Schistosoma mansoni]